MLVLTRKIGEKIVLGKDITISVLEMSGGKVKLGIEAPRGVAVDREEVSRAKAAAPRPSPVA